VPDRLPEDRRTPTVVIARKIAPGREADFRRWIARLHDAVASQPGYLHDDHQPPDERHPDEWVVTYRFADSDSLEAWLDSPIRRQLIEEERDLIVGTPRAQVVAIPGAGVIRPVTAVISSHVKPGQEAAYRRAHDLIAVEMAGTPGFLRSEMFDPAPPVQPETIVVFSFDTREHLDAWLESDRRQAVIAPLEPLIEGERVLNIVGGYAGWFPQADDRPIKVWKQSIAVLLGLFPISLLVTIVRNAVAPDLPLVPAVLVGNAIGVLALSYVLMPRITRWLADWLKA
jgi:uncharacterized protein